MEKYNKKRLKSRMMVETPGLVTDFEKENLATI
jgi:hypothetical protein